METNKRTTQKTNGDIKTTIKQLTTKRNWKQKNQQTK